MVDCVIGEIRPFAGNYAPEGWLICDGQSVRIADNPTLYTLIGTRYGGDGTTTFNLPDLRGRLPVGQGQGAGLHLRAIGQTGGTSQVSLTEATLPTHAHRFNISTKVGSTGQVHPSTALAVPAPQTGGTIYAYAPPNALGDAKTFAPQTVLPTGGGGGHSNVMPYTAITYIIAMTGSYPNRP